MNFIAVKWIMSQAFDDFINTGLDLSDKMSKRRRLELYLKGGDVPNMAIFVTIPMTEVMDLMTEICIDEVHSKETINEDSLERMKTMRHKMKFKVNNFKHRFNYLGYKKK